MGEALKIPSYRRWVSYFSQRHAPLRGVHDPVRLSRVEFCQKALVDPRNFFLRTINQSPILFKAKVRCFQPPCPVSIWPHYPAHAFRVNPKP
jgi:hypothetical protein